MSLTPSGKDVGLRQIEGIHQVISTTLTGKQESIQDAIVFDGWSTFSFHLPDSHGLMTGLKVTLNMQNFLITLCHIDSKNYSRMKKQELCFGDDFHPLIKPIIYKYAKGLIQLNMLN